jgi:hypothetical protein
VVVHAHLYAPRKMVLPRWMGESTATAWSRK